MEEIKVSILTATYNHAPFIAQALDSFLAQKADFLFEIIVHDDASLDGTAQIISQYAEQYPGIIHPVLQTVNQHSQGKNIYDFMLPLARGKYVAQCEGDDYWCDEQKLQKQVDALDQHTECVYCFSNSYQVNLQSEIVGVQTPVKGESRIFDSREIIAAPEVFLATASTMYRTEAGKNFPPQLLAGEAGDVPLRNYLMTQGCAYGFVERMACYRVMTPGSWSQRMCATHKTVTPAVLRANDAYIDYFRRFDQYTHEVYHKELLPNLWKRISRKVKLERELSILKKQPYRDVFKAQPKKKRILFYLEYCFPCMMKTVYRIKNKLQRKE